jgi:transketolase
MTAEPIEQLGINVIRALAMDCPKQANSGHSGTAMALAPLAHVLWSRVMRYDATHPDWPNRDRFVLSCGHASVLLYSMLYLTGFGVELEDLAKSRQLGSATPGHPEARLSHGIEATTGPLGQGFANAVGMAVAERLLRSRYGPDLIDHYTFVICSDGDLMEGISHEAASFAGHLGLGRLICIYDDNRITIDGPTDLTVGDDAVGRFRSYGWHAEAVGEIANDIDALEAAIRQAMAVDDAPSLVQLRTHIGWPAPHLTDSPKAHADPFADDEIRATKVALGLPADETLWVPNEVLAYYRAAGQRGASNRAAWYDHLHLSLKQAGLRQDDWDALWEAQPLPEFVKLLPIWRESDATTAVATRAAFKTCLNAVAPAVPALVSGSADLTANTGTRLEDTSVQSREHPDGRLMAFGVREHGMGGVMTGMAAHGGVLPVGGTFFAFSDYMRGSVRTAALSGAKVIFVWTHDSIGVGEDGPTHQPVEQLAAFRAMPNLYVIRPADANETTHAVRVALTHNGPTALVLSRQALPLLENTAERGAQLERGAYTLFESVAGKRPDVVLIGTGSEVSLCLEASRLLADDGIAARVVSMPCWELFEQQDDGYQEMVLGSGVPVLAVEAAASLGWSRWADASVTLDRFGISGPGAEVLAKFGFTPENVAECARQLLESRSPRARRTPVTTAVAAPQGRLSVPAEHPRARW